MREMRGFPPAGGLVAAVGASCGLGALRGESDGGDDMKEIKEEEDPSDKAEKKRILMSYRQSIYDETQARFLSETGPSEEEELGNLVGGLGDVGVRGYLHFLVRPRPNATHLRFRFTPDLQRSRAYPLHPAEDRPPLDELDSEEPPTRRAAEAAADGDTQPPRKALVEAIELGGSTRLGEGEAGLSA